MRALHLEKLPAWPMEDLNIEGEIDQPDLLKLSNSSSRSSDSSVILLANSRELNPFEEISRLSKDGCRDISDSILANLVKGQSSRPSKSREEQLAMTISKSPLKACSSDPGSWKANELFTTDWRNAKNEIVRVHLEESWRDLCMVDVPKMWLKPTASYVKKKKSMRTPIDLFDSDTVFDKVESMHSDSWLSESSRGHCSNISETPDSVYANDMERVAELEVVLANVWDTVETLSAKNKKLQEDKKRIEAVAAATAQDFQKTIDQLVSEVVRLEDESQEMRLVMTCIWEESQIAQEAAKNRRKMVTSLRRDNTDLRVKNSRLQILYGKMFNMNMMDLNKENTIDLMTTVSNFVGVFPGSPITGQKVETMSKRERELFLSNNDILKEDKLILKPESDVNEYRLSKFADVDFGDDKLFKVTIEEIGPATISIVTSFKITNHKGEISDLIANFRKIGSRQPYGKSNENERDSAQKTEVDGFGEAVKFQSSKPYSPKLSSLGSYQCDNVHCRSRSLSKLQEVQTRSPRAWSAPPNRSVCISLLQSLERLSSPSSMKAHDHRQNRLTQKIKSDASDVIRRLLSNQNQRNDTYISDDKIPAYFPTSKICDLATRSCHTAQLNTNTPQDSQESINLYQDIEQNHTIVPPASDSRRASSEWTEISNGGRELDILECHKSTNKSDNKLSVQPQSCISFASRDWKMREMKRHFKVKKRRKRKSRKKASVRTFDYEIGKRSPSFTFVI